MTLSTGMRPVPGSKPQPDSKLSLPRFRVCCKQRFRDTKYSGGKMILIGQLFAVGSPNLVIQNL